MRSSVPRSCRLPSTPRLDAPPKSEAILLPRYASRYAKPLAMGALSERPPFAASGTACTRRVAGDAVEGDWPPRRGENNLVPHAWRKKPKHWRAITRTPVDFFVSVSRDPWWDRHVLWLRIVGGPGYPAHQPGPGRGRSLFAGKNIVSEMPDPPPRGKISREKQAPACAGRSREARCIS